MIFFSIVWGVCFCMLVCTSCTSDELSMNGSDTEYVSLDLQLEGTPVVLTKATEPGEEHKNEDKIEHVDVYIFKQDGNKQHYQRVTVGTDMKVTLSLRKEVVKGGAYDVYVVANCNLEENTMESAQTVDALMNLCTTTEFLFPTGQAVYEPSFLMDGKELNVTSLGDDVSSLTINLKRAAAKIRVKINYGEVENEDGTTTKFELSGLPKKKMINYATKTTLCEDSQLSSQSDFERGLRSMDSYVNITENEAVFYSYANTWQYNPESPEVDLKNETYILLDIPVMVTTTDESGNTISSEAFSPNYYSVSLNGASGTQQKLERNHFYDITVTVKAKGSATEVKPISLQGSLQVQNWQSQTINVGSDDAHYLEVSDDTIRITNSGEDNSVIFYSSEAVTNVEIEIGSVRFIDKFGVEKSIPQTGYNAYPNSDYLPTVTIDEGNTGIIHIKSKELINVPKTFTILVTSGGITRKIFVEQYPLEYITSTQGWYSYRDNVASTYEKFVNKDYSINTDIFNAKVAKSYNTSTGASTLYYYRWDRNGNLTENNRVSNNTNARMYHVHITTTPQAGDVSYRLGYPKLNSNEVTDSGNDNKTLVSPSFMIASQLGSVNPGLVENLTEAATHCKNYAEVTGVIWKNGSADYSHVKYYDDWRLPTEAELKIIALYQDKENSAIDKVLAGTYYWAAHGTVRVNGGTSGTGLRCVRDVK